MAFKYWKAQSRNHEKQVFKETDGSTLVTLEWGCWIPSIRFYFLTNEFLGQSPKAKISWKAGVKESLFVMHNAWFQNVHFSGSSRDNEVYSTASEGGKDLGYRREFFDRSTRMCKCVWDWHKLSSGENRLHSMGTIRSDGKWDHFSLGRDKNRNESRCKSSIFNEGSSFSFEGYNMSMSLLRRNITCLKNRNHL